MYYEINVAKKNKRGDYIHYFATAKRSLTSASETAVVLNQFVQLFTEPEYNISVSKIEETGEGFNVNDFLAEHL